MSQSVKKKLDPVATRASILESGFGIFSQKGFSGTSIGDIADASGVPKSLVLYHFGSKEQLWQECVKHRAAPMIQLLDRFISEGGTIRELMEARIQLHESNPSLARMLAWASLDPVPLPEFLVERREMILKRFQGQGFGARIFLALATIDGWYLYRNLYRRFAGDQTIDGVDREDLLQKALAIVEAA